MTYIHLSLEWSQFHGIVEIGRRRLRRGNRLFPVRLDGQTQKKKERKKNEQGLGSRIVSHLQWGRILKRRQREALQSWWLRGRRVNPWGAENIKKKKKIRRRKKWGKSSQEMRQVGLVWDLLCIGGAWVEDMAAVKDRKCMETGEQQRKFERKGKGKEKKRKRIKESKNQKKKKQND